jgi:hypothetical protein
MGPTYGRRLSCVEPTLGIQFVVVASTQSATTEPRSPRSAAIIMGHHRKYVCACVRLSLDLYL